MLELKGMHRQTGEMFVAILGLLKELSGSIACNLHQHTLKCLSIGTPKIINFPFVPNEKLMIFRCPNIQTDYNEAVLCLNFGTPKNNQFSIWDKWKIYYF